MNVTEENRFDIQSKGQSNEEITQMLEELKDQVVQQNCKSVGLAGDHHLKYTEDTEESEEQNENKDSTDNSVEQLKDSPHNKVFTTKAIEEEMSSLHISSKPKRRIRTEKWGESVGIVDESGRPKRVIAMSELHNYLILESLDSKIKSKIYCSLINERYPRFYDSTIEYFQRWRMRYNIFVDKVMADKSDDSLLHIGELHLYFDLIPKFKTPFYINNSFYSNPNDAEKALNLESLKIITDAFNGLRRSRSIYQLKFPIRLYLFQNVDYVFDKFEERHQEIMDESRAVNRKEMTRKFREKNRPPIRERVPSFRERKPSINGGMAQLRELPPMSREFPPIGRNFEQRGRNFAQKPRMRQRSDTYEEVDQKRDNERQNFEYKERGYERNSISGQRGRYNRRGFNNRKPFNSKPKTTNRTTIGRPRYDSNVDTDVVFEDTRERHERSGGKPQRETYVHPNRRSFNSHNMEAYKESHFSSNYTPATGSLFSATEMDSNRVTSVHSFGQPVGYNRYGSTNN